LNNALTPVLMGVTLLEHEKISPDGVRMLELMGKGAARCSEMVRQILSFSRGVGGATTSVAINDLVEEMVRLAEKTFPDTVKIKTVPAADLMKIRANPTQLHQVLLNLCINARDAMPNGGSLTIQTENANLSGESLPPGRGLSAGPYVIIKVTDTGHGIAPELLGRIFEPFFTTKELGHGTGFGLSTVMGIVKTHSGFVEVTSQVGSGSTFKVGLPVRPATAAP
jgi:signal transduction histidine kinase